ncbi:hypothetical protein CBD41_02380 [bacterium TMED181]|nr:vitamin K-dependent gamma-carboxylase [Planctomycetota bacterium]OUW46610.1 MAG: hypothetical protein CBD41_02380 [bacterium TMED181]
MDQPPSNRLQDSLFKPVDIAWLVAFRIFTGGLMLFEMVRYLAEGWLKSYYIDTPFHLKFFGFSWVQQLPSDWAMQAIFLILIASSLGVTIGYRYRLSATLQFICFTYLFLLDAAGYRNHWYLLSLLCFFLIFLPAHRAFSMDCQRIQGLQRNWCQQWQLWLIRGQLALVYFYAGIAKLDHGWMSGESIRVIFTAEGHSPEMLNFLFQPAVTQFFVWSGMLFDLTIPFFLLWKRTRLLAFLGAAGFHLTNGIFLVSVGIFPWFMLMAGTLYFEPDWPRKILGKLGFASGAKVAIPTSCPETEDDTRLPRPLLTTIISVYLILQILIPLRQHLYDGYTSWTHEGHRWAWRMKLVNKRVQKVEIFTFDPDSGKRVNLTPNFTNVLVRWQQSRVAEQPDLFLQFTRDLGEKLKEKQKKDYPIHANVEISINGKPAAPLYDPSVDLSKVEWSLAKKDWLLPYPRQ